ncbi:ATP-binding cassette domain-containing protein [Lachnotalea glycerini]|uniref:UvrABC system protein A n=2 Tax=Lachnotalea glycerini TaxID=1763509 RepID=A0A371JBH0_9FIRM|nr:ATP-binding cassette domain-containing protein [Lachnotalea glycerini]
MVYISDRIEEGEHVMYKVKAIGKVESRKEETIIYVNKQFQKALKHLDEFSHIHVFFVIDYNEKCKMKKVILQIKKMNLNKGCIISSTTLDIDKEAELIDIKPYFPSEDTVKTPIYLSEKSEDYIEVEKINDSANYEVSSIGEIRNVNGNNYIQLDNRITITGMYITIFWWFHKFDTDKYRGVTECNPPYEDAPRSGIFATRSPVRPNPIAMTVARVIKIDDEKKRIYLNGIESFDKTPCLGISEYDSREHCTYDSSIPKWLQHWPKSIDDTIQNRKDSEIKMIDSKLKSLLSECEPRERIKLKNKIERKIEDRKQSEIIVYGARENNLKGLDIRVPYRKITAVVGVSGSGKSSLVNNTIYAECRRRMEYLSHSHNILQNPNVDEMVGCIPAVVITQNAIHGNIFSTVGTYTDVYDYLRNIYASVSVRHCPNCGNEIIPLSKDKILTVLKSKENIKIFNLSNEMIVDESLEKMVEIAIENGEGAFCAELDNKERVMLQTKQKCYHCDKLMFEITPATFSYMDTDSRCPVCSGTGKTVVIDENKVIEHPKLSLLDGASSFYGKLRVFRDNSNANWMKGQVFGLADAMNVDLEKPWCELPIAYREALLHGSKQEVTFKYDNKKNGRKGEIKRQVEGLFPIIERIYEENSTTNTRDKYMMKTTCNTCNGERLGKEGRMATIHQIRYPEAANMTFYEIREFCNILIENLSDNEFTKTEYAVRSLIEISETAIQLGIGYLQLSQATSTLSGGEGQRLKLLGAFKNHISGILYIFDEPSKGLHPSDYKKIIDLLQALVKEGNTIIIVEHNEDMIRIADNIIEIGPGAGEKGGTLVGEGTLETMMNHNGTQISKYMNYNAQLKKVRNRNTPLNHELIRMQNMSYNNLKNISVEFPKKALTCICGVSGSGKSSLMKGEIYSRVQSNKEFSGVVLVDQLPIGKTSKSIVATYIGIMDFIRSEFATAPLSVENGWDDKYFSFNGQYGQCETCMGEGKIKVKYTEGTLVECPDCKGKRYKKKILSVLYKDKRIDEILTMSVNEAIQLWDELEAVDGLRSLQKVGLGYLKLSQGTSTLSGGEAARLKLAKELISKKSSNVLYLLDEPTTGLHFSDIENLLKLLDELITSGNTVISIEHNKQFMENCDWKIELGPGAGKDGGNVISQGAV